ncbi:MAG: hypothetical protein ACP5NV_01555 [Candidatus Woesearchaeota archaeon]
MQLGHFLLIDGKDMTLAKHGSKLLGKHFYVEVFNFHRTNQEIKRVLKRVPKIYILHKEQEEVFKQRWPEIYAEKKPLCMNIPSDISSDEMKKLLEKELMMYLIELLSLNQ